jgi:hypothetical protein
MEAGIKKSLDDYYGIIREAEYKMKDQFNDIWNLILDDENKLIKYSEKDEIVKSSGKKIQNILDKILSKFDNNFKFVMNDDGNINIVFKMKSICMIILYKIKIVVRFMNYDMTLNGIDDDTKLLDAFILNKNINI